MTKDEMQQIRDALANIKSYGDVYRYKAHEVNPYVQLLNALRVIDAELAKPEQEPVYDQTALELCEVCGWKTLIPGDCCLNCERKKVEQEPVAWVEVTHSTQEQYKFHGIKYLPVGKHSLYTAPTPAPQREWQGLTKDEINDCAGAEIYPSTWAMAFTVGIEQTLKRKNT